MQTAKYILFIAFATAPHISFGYLIDGEFYAGCTPVDPRARLHKVTLQNNHNRPIKLYYKKIKTLPRIVRGFDIGVICTFKEKKATYNLLPEKNKTIRALKNRRMCYRILRACPPECERTDKHHHYSKRIRISKKLADTGQVVLKKKEPIVKSANKQ